MFDWCGFILAREKLWAAAIHGSGGVDQCGYFVAPDSETSLPGLDAFGSGFGLGDDARHFIHRFLWRGNAGGAGHEDERCRSSGASRC